MFQVALLELETVTSSHYLRGRGQGPQWAGYNWLGVFYYHRAQYREAAEMFEQVVALAPGNSGHILASPCWQVNRA
jgi:lipoprotein NlpI